MQNFGPQIFIDLETTGLNPNQERICQIGAILPNGEEINTFINPHKKIPSKITKLTGIRDEDVVNAPDFEEVADTLIKALEEAEIFIAYNFAFDFQFLQNELFKTAHYELKEEDFIFIDPYKIFRKMFPHNLSNAYYFYTGKQIQGAHNAIDDIRATKEILDKQKELYTDLFAKDPKTIEEETIGDTSILGKWFEKDINGYRYKQGKFRGELVEGSQEQYLRWIYSLEDVTLSEKRYISGIIGSPLRG
jgi:DNA polymerase III epsilon subunit family exonuclease